MVKRKKPATKAAVAKDRLLPKITLWFFDRPRKVALLWLVLVIFGIASYTTLLKREGFPSVNIPLAVVGGSYFVNDPSKVDSEVAKPIADLALKQDGVSSVQTSSQANFFTITIQYEESVDAKAATKKLESQVNATANLPDAVQAQYNVPYFGVTGGDAKKIDATLAFYDPAGKLTTRQLTDNAEELTTYLNSHKPELVKEFFVQNPYDSATDPTTGQEQIIQTNFDRFGARQNSNNDFFNSITIGVTSVNGADVIELDAQLQELLGSVNSNKDFSAYETRISASYAPGIKENISELQRVLLEGLIAVLIIGSLVIAMRASFITVISMATVLAITIGLLYIVGYSLNVITLFALILGLSLIVDDTIIMVEAIDAARRRTKNSREAVQTATRKVSRAMIAATLTAMLSFAPLLFVGGVLGSFIRAIPVTIISALFISLLVALIFIPLFARYILLGKKQMGDKGVKELASGIEEGIARVICKPMLWARNSTKKLISVGLSAVVIGVLFVMGAGFIAQKVTFNIFPPTKDTNGLIVSLAFPDGTTLPEAEAFTDEANKIAGRIVGEDFKQLTYFNSGTSSAATAQIDISSYNERDVTAREIADELKAVYDKELPDVTSSVGQLDVGPPAGTFTVNIESEDRTAAYELANDLAKFLGDATLTRPDGSEAHINDVRVAASDTYTRSDGKMTVQVTGVFDGDDTTTLVTLAQTAVEDEFTSEKVESYGLDAHAIQFDLGQESENQDSFKTLAIAFPLVLIAIYILLLIEFRSFLQPLLIFLAIPFSLFGVMLGLFITDNAISFFSMLGFFALIGLSLKNTILLTDYANQSRRAGMGAIDAAVAALGERFRPLIATSLTAVVSLIPLALTSPFWQGLAVVLIFGLLSSTLLVVTVFPYYYLGGEFLRMHINRRSGLLWVGLTVLLMFALGGVQPLFILLAPIMAALIVWTLNKLISSNKKGNK